MAEPGQKILDINTFTGDGSTIEFITNVEYQTGMTHFVNIIGIAQNVTIFVVAFCLIFQKKIEASMHF